MCIRDSILCTLNEKRIVPRTVRQLSITKATLAGVNILKNTNYGPRAISWALSFFRYFGLHLLNSEVLPAPNVFSTEDGICWCGQNGLNIAYVLQKVKYKQSTTAQQTCS